MSPVQWFVFVVTLCPVLVRQGAPRQSLPIKVGDVVNGEVTNDRPVVRTPTLEGNYTDAPARGVSFRAELPTGPVTIELRSYFFDAYLVVRNEKGELVAEDDDGLLGSHAQIVLKPTTAATFEVVACALHGDAGPFELRIAAGEPAAIGARQKREAELEDARRAVDVVEARLGPEHVRTAAKLDELGVLLFGQGKYEEARPIYGRALAIKEKVLGPTDPSTATSLRNLAVLFRSEGKYEEARPLVERALAIDEKTLGPGHRDTASSLYDLAMLLHTEGKFAEARPLYERALAIREKALGPEHRDTAASLNGLAALLHDEGKYAEARPLYERALAIWEKVFGREHPYTATTVDNLAGLLYSEGRYEEARPLYERSVAIREKTLGPEHPDTALSLNNLANVLRALKRYEEAYRLCQRALAIDEKVLGPVHADTALALGNLAALIDLQGKYEEARPLYERAVAIDEKVFGPDNPQTATHRNNLAKVLESEGKYEEARPLLERTHAVFEKAWGRTCSETVNGLGNILLMELNSRGPAQVRARADELLESARAYAFERASQAFSSDALRAFSAVNDALAAWLSTATIAERATDAVYAQVLLTKGETCRLMDQRRHALAERSDSETRDVLDRLQAVRAAMSNLISVSGATNRAEHEHNLERLRKEREECETKLARIVAARPELQTVTPADVRSALPKDAVLLDFLEHRLYEPAEWKDGKVVKLGQWGETHFSVWISRASANTPMWIDLGPSDAIESALGRALDAIRAEVAADPRGAGAVAPIGGVDSKSSTSEARRQLLREVRKLLWDPLLPYVAGATKVLVAADGCIATLPFGILEDDESKTLVERYSFRAIDDVARVVRHPPGTAANATAVPSLLSIGAVDYDEAGAPPKDAAVANAEQHGAFVQNLGALPNTGIEADAVVAMHVQRFPTAARVSLRGRDPSEERVKIELGKARYVHLATHGYFDVESLASSPKKRRDASSDDRFFSDERQLAVDYWPQFLCGVVCAGANHPQSGRDNGLLTADEVGGLNLLSCDLVVLSACETALGRAASGEGVLSLTHSFREAGAKTVVSTLWNVRDDSTKDLMLDFYDRLWSQNEKKLDALRDAQLDLLNKNRKKYGDTRPATWGAFVLTGETD